MAEDKNTPDLPSHELAKHSDPGEKSPPEETGRHIEEEDLYETLAYSEPGGNIVNILNIGSSPSSFSSPESLATLADAITEEQFSEILKMAGKRLDHDFEMEKQDRKIEEKIVDAEILDQRTQRSITKLGQIYAFIVTVLGFALVVYCAAIGERAIAISFGAVGITGLAVVFIKGLQYRQEALSTQELPSDDNKEEEEANNNS